MPLRRTAFTLIELLVVISIIALLIAILLPALGAARKSARKLQSNTQIRGVQQGLFIYAQSNKDLYPGLRKLDFNSLPNAAVDAADIDSYTAGGTVAGAHVGGRYALALDEDLFSPDYLVSPLEVTSSIQPWDEGRSYREQDIFFSYALPRIQRGSNKLSDGRAYEWQAQANSQAVVVSDRLYRLANQTITDPDTHVSIAEPENRGAWEGGISFNDNHVESYQTSAIDTVLSYANVKTDGPDNLFDARKVGNQRTPAGSETQYNAQQIIRGVDSARLPPSQEGE
ncbi:MAG: prepilin-type N-terminal cleavage/methylation domain-containing protein [Phycisphaeraceae bacterium]